MRHKINVVIFDFDGVIVDSSEDIVSAVQYTLKQFRQPALSAKEIISYVGNGAEMLIRSCFKNCSEEIIKEAYPFYRKYYLANAIVKTKLYDNVKETLETLKTKEYNKKIALVTNKPEELTVKILEVLDAAGHFDLIVGPESVKRLKPDPEGIKKALARFDETPERAVMVGDTSTDIEAGKAAGTFTCGVTYGIGDRTGLENASPDFLINNMLQLLDNIE